MQGERKELGWQVVNNWGGGKAYYNEEIIAAVQHIWISVGSSHSRDHNMGESKIIHRDVAFMATSCHGSY